MYLRLLRHNRDFRLLYLATLISLGGDWFLTVALDFRFRVARAVELGKERVAFDLGMDAGEVHAVGAVH